MKLSQIVKLAASPQWSVIDIKPAKGLGDNDFTRLVLDVAKHFKLGHKNYAGVTKGQNVWSFQFTGADPKKVRAYIQKWFKDYDPQAY